jgi:hypothetical protein
VLLTQAKYTTERYLPVRFYTIRRYLPVNEGNPVYE